MNNKEQPNIYELNRDWWNFCFENPEKIKPIHTAIYLFAIEHCNRLAWKSKFGLPTTMAMEAIGVKSYNTYINALRELVDWGFIVMIEKSKNQHSSNIVALSKNNKAHNKALDKAMYKHASKQSESTGQSNGSIDIPITSVPDTYLPKESAPSQKSDSEIQSERIAAHLLESICEYDPTHKYNRNEPALSTWEKEIERAIRLDGRTEEQLTFIIDYIYKKQGKNSSFWAGNIESGNKLRQHFDKIKNQITAENQTNGKKSISTKITETEQFLASYQR